jgi:hypothetical protein
MSRNPHGTINLPDVAVDASDDVVDSARSCTDLDVTTMPAIHVQHGPMFVRIRFGARFESATRTDGSEVRESGPFVVGNASLRLGPLCPTDRGASLSFSAYSATELHLYSTTNGVVREEVFIAAP